MAVPAAEAAAQFHAGAVRGVDGFDDALQRARAVRHGAQVAAEYVIVMPADPSARAKVIEAYNNFWKTDWDKLEPEEQDELKSEFVTDHGQKYLSLMYDP